jgi:hypothetical protein
MLHQFHAQNLVLGNFGQILREEISDFPEFNQHSFSHNLSQPQRSGPTPLKYISGCLLPHQFLVLPRQYYQIPRLASSFQILQCLGQPNWKPPLHLGKTQALKWN